MCVCVYVCMYINILDIIMYIGYIEFVCFILIVFENIILSIVFEIY